MPSSNAPWTVNVPVEDLMRLQKTIEEYPTVVAEVKQLRNEVNALRSILFQYVERNPHKFVL